jgi:hypothetical protein
MSASAREGPLALQEVTGDPGLLGAMTRRLRDRVAAIPRRSARGAYAVSVHVDRRSRGGDDVTVSCRATIAAEPRHSIAGSLSARAEVTGEGIDADELADDAVSACADDLVAALDQWLRRR